MVTLRIVAATLALLSLGSCARDFVVEAALIDGALVFKSDDDNRTSPPWCWENLTILDEAGRPVWEFEVPPGAFNEQTGCGPNFPIRYGIAPPKAETFVAPQTLVVGQTYVIIGHSGGGLDGAFKFVNSDAGMRIQNLPSVSDTAKKARGLYWDWERAHDPPRVSQKQTEYNPFVEPPPLSIPLDPQKGDAGRDEFTWVLGPDEWYNMPSLSYQTLGTEKKLISLSCRYTNAPIYLLVPPGAATSSSLQIKSGPHKVGVKTVRAGNPGKRTRIDAIVPWEPALFRSFAETGSLTVETAQVAMNIDAINDEERAVVGRFFQLCAGKLPRPLSQKS